MESLLREIELLGKNWLVDKRSREFRYVEDGGPIVFLKSREMDDLLIIDEIIGDHTKFEIDEETLSKLIKLRDSAMKGDRTAIETISKICDQDYCDQDCDQDCR